jgi:hypothetical protein
METEILKELAFPLKKQLFIDKLTSLPISGWERKIAPCTFYRKLSDYSIKVSSCISGEGIYFNIDIFNDDYVAQVQIDKHVNPKDYETVDRFLTRIIEHKNPKIVEAEKEMVSWLSHRGGGTIAIL